MKLLRGLTFGLWAVLAVVASRAAAEAPAAANAAFNSYVATVEARLAKQHSGAAGFVVPVGLKDGVAIEAMGAPAVPGGLMHHWRGTAFVPGGRAADLERVLRDFAGYPRVYAPQVLKAAVLSEQGDHMVATMRVRQKHVITVVLDTRYDVNFGRLDARDGYSVSRSTHVDEIEGAGTSTEHAVSEAQEHGFLWRQNTYWSYAEKDGGLYIQIESVMLTRGIPRGLGWAVGPFVESIPRESLEFTLKATGSALHK